ncbi:hypothetical protein BLNAU_23382 [Blattamonas nauphoetae]|uniref:Uncharacterized protein n=1 Tax=Blattamonas nauphoetae TaxID=2049346 RepID=A0ABQ9WQU7_9EUKA|nr:hypothetical protein BLNAU_23382 [Blattamonas nauphoetae]
MNRSSYYLFRFSATIYFVPPAPLDCIRFTCRKGTHNSFFVRVIAQICVSASKLATDLDWNQVFRPHLLLSPPYKGSPPFTPLPVSCLFSDVPNINPKLEVVFDLAHSPRRKEGVSAPSHLFRLAAHCHPSLPLLPFSTLLQRRLANEVCGAGEVDLCVLTLSSLLTNTHVAVTQSNQESGEGSWCVVDQKATRDKEERKCEGGKEQKTDGGEPEAKEDEEQLLNQTKWNRIRSVRLPNTLPDTSHHTPCHSNHNVQSSPDFDAEWHSYSHNEVGVGKSDERGEKERKKVVVKFMIDSLLSFIRKEMKTRTIKLVTLNPTRIVDNAQSELIVVFFPPLCSTGLDETKRAPNAFEMSVVGFDEFSIEPLFVTAGEKSMLLNSHLKTTRMSVGEEVEEGRERDQLE